MIEFLFTSGQVVCLAGYLYGACAAIGGTGRSLVRELARRSQPDARQEIEDSVYLRRYLTLDA